MCKNIAAGIVLYNPDISRLKKNLDAVSPQVDKIFLVDNASENKSEIQDLLKTYQNCEIIWNEQNEGVAKALNQIFHKGTLQKYSWILTLDDDSVCDNDMVAWLLPYTNRKKVGIIGPRALDDKMHTEDICEDEFAEIDSCITAGSLTSTVAWQNIHGFDEKMFIDFVDVEFCTRLRRSGYQIIQVNHTFIHQEYGNIRGTIRLFGRHLYLFDYSPMRIYFSVRNQIYYMNKHKGFINRRRWLLFLAGYVGKRIIFERQRWSSMKMIAKGIRDGIKMSEQC